MCLRNLSNLMAFLEHGIDTSSARPSVEKYQRQFSWLRDTNFLHDLENDSVDSEIIEEELSALQEEERPTSHVLAYRRKKIVKLLQSNPVQILLFILVLLDAGVVIAQIILDINSIKDKLYNREDQITKLLLHISRNHPSDLCGINHLDIDAIVSALENPLQCGNFSAPPAYTPHTKHKRESSGIIHKMSHKVSDVITQISNNKSSRADQDAADSGDSVIKAMSSDKPEGDNIHQDNNPRNSHHTPHLANSRAKSRIPRRSRFRKRHLAPRSAAHQPPDDGTWGNAYDGNSIPVLNLSSSKCEGDAVACEEWKKNVTDYYKQHLFANEHDPLHDIAHGLHFASIAILAFLVAEDFVKIAAMGKDFFKHKVEVVDGVIIVASLVMDIIFLGGMSGEEGQKAVAILIILLLWRIARVTDGIVITVKQRQEFRIRLQKRARRNAERRIDNLEEERHCRVKQIQALKDLCSKAGIRDEEIEACAPRRAPRRVSTTMCALSSVARLSVSMTMSMSSGLFSLLDDDTAAKAPDRNFNTQKDVIAVADGSCSPLSKRRKSEGNIFISPKSLRKKIVSQKTPSSASGSPAQASPGKSFSFTKKRSENSTPTPQSKKRKKLKEVSKSPKVKSKIKKDKKEEEEVKKDASPLSSPVNSSGVQIVIHEGSDSESSFAVEEDAASDSASEVTLCFKAASTLSTEKSLTDMNQVLLLNEIS